MAVSTPTPKAGAFCHPKVHLFVNALSHSSTCCVWPLCCLYIMLMLCQKQQPYGTVVTQGAPTWVQVLALACEQPAALLPFQELQPFQGAHAYKYTFNGQMSCQRRLECGEMHNKGSKGCNLRQ